MKEHPEEVDDMLTVVTELRVLALAREISDGEYAGALEKL